MKEKIHISTLVPGSCFNNHLWDKKNNLLLPAYHSITQSYIDEWQDDGEYIFTEGTISSKSDLSLTGELPGYIDKDTRSLLHIYYESVFQLKNLYQKPSNIDLVQLQQIVSPWVSYTLTHTNLSTLLKVCRYSVFNPDDYFYIHSIDTMIISLGIYKQYYEEVSTNSLTKIALGALLSDIGMVLLPQDLTKTNDIYSLEQKQEIQKHTLLGYSFLLTKLALPQEIALPALEHHERPDGSGYPYNHSGDQLHPNSIIISLADVFASQIHTRAYRSSREPAEILKDFIQTMMPIFPSEYQTYISAFISFTSIYPVTSVLELSTGDIAIVSETYPHAPIRPKVMILTSKDKVPNNSVVEIDLSHEENKHITITGVYTQEMLESLNI